MKWVVAFAPALALGLAFAPAARADDTRSGVKPQSTVEVLDDKAQIDDVISRLQKPPAEVKHVDPQPAQDLKSQRPQLPTAQPPEKKVTPDSKAGQRWRQSHRERGAGTPERTERPRHVRP